MKDITLKDIKEFIENLYFELELPVGKEWDFKNDSEVEVTEEIIEKISGLTGTTTKFWKDTLKKNHYKPESIYFRDYTKNLLNQKASQTDIKDKCNRENITLIYDGITSNLYVNNCSKYSLINILKMQHNDSKSCKQLQDKLSGLKYIYISYSIRGRHCNSVYFNVLYKVEEDVKTIISRIIGKHLDDIYLLEEKMNEENLIKESRKQDTVNKFFN